MAQRREGVHHQQGEQRVHAQAGDRTGGHRDAAPAVEAQVHGPAIADHRAHRGDGRNIDGEAQPAGHQHRHQSLGELQRPDEHREVKPGVPVHVSGADVARAVTTHIKTESLPAHQQPADGYAADQVREHAHGNGAPHEGHVYHGLDGDAGGGSDVSARPCAIVVDGGAGLEENPAAGLAVVPQRLIIGGEEFVDAGRSDGYASFYQKLRSGAKVATSTPSPGEYLDAFGRCDADAVVCLTIPARWSGMHDAAELAAGMLAEREGLRRVTVIDTGTAAGGYALVARVAAAMWAHGASLDEVRAELRGACAGVRTYG